MTSWSEIKRMAATDVPFSAIPAGTELVSVVGVSFVPEYPKNILSLVNADMVHLVRNPDNQYDQNAIEVRSGDQLLGHIPKDIAARLAPRMDAGTSYVAAVHHVRISPENPNNPGLDIVIGEWA